jgi:hypothetical protein
MMEWTEELLMQVQAFSHAALSYLGSDGYPVVLPLPLTFDGDKRCFTLPIPQQKPAPASEEQVSLTLLRYDEHIKGERYLLFYGQLTETGEKWTFTPSSMVPAPGLRGASSSR